MYILNNVSVLDWVKQAIKNDRVIDCLLQICIADEDTKFGARLFAPFVLLVDYAATDYVFDGVAGKVEFTGNLTNCFAVSEISQTDFSNGIHDQHLLESSSLFIESREYGAGC